MDKRGAALNATTNLPKSFLIFIGMACVHNFKSNKLNQFWACKTVI